jgi:hypothetical protein
MFQETQKRSITKILELFSEVPESVSASVLSMGRFRNFTAICYFVRPGAPINRFVGSGRCLGQARTCG